MALTLSSGKPLSRSGCKVTKSNVDCKSGICYTRIGRSETVPARAGAVFLRRKTGRAGIRHGKRRDYGEKRI
ncbi:hypothetical protein [Sellimonas intestinalis]|uniref:hypothetical protein n=1 Tax=Sellimonas intestinalis TaxID=1653434 RepID=UPI003AB62295